jgi:CHAD domain-containing protein
MKQTVEREVKLEPGEGFVLPDLGGEAQPTRVFSSTYHDTADLVLARNGLTLRHRVEGGTGLWQLKLPGGDDARLELELPGQPARPPLELVSLLVGFLRGRDLRPVARLRTRRNVVRTAGAEIVDDTVSVMQGQRVVRRFREVEVELLDGADVRTLRRLEKKLRRAGASTGEGRPKLFQALELDSPAAPRDVPPGAPPSVALGIALGEQAQRILAHDPGTRLGSDPEELHKMRVATRRLRAFLRAGGTLLDPDWSSSLRSELQWLGRALGPARDLDVLTDYLAAEIETLGEDAAAGRSLLDGLGAERAAARQAVVEALSSDRYLALLDRLDRVTAPVVSGDETPLANRWRKEWKRAKRAISALDDDSSDQELHESRIRLKKARYAAELAGHELGRKGERFASAASKLQDFLGAHQDAAVAEERIRAWAAGPGVPAGVAEPLIELQVERRREARAALPAAWKKVRRKAKRIG